MNPRRIAAALRQLADAIDEPDASPTPPLSEPRRKRARQVYRPDGDVSPEASAKAERALRRAGLVKGG